MEAPSRPRPAVGPEADRTGWFAHARVGVHVHWGLSAIPARGAAVQAREGIPAGVYAAYRDEFAPTRYDPRRWAGLFRRAGALYALLSAKHHDGFALFHSAHTDFGVRHAPIGRDLALEFVDACREAGLKVGFSYSLTDWHHQPAQSAADYLRFVREQLTELLSNYGRIDVLRLEGGGALGPAGWDDELAQHIRGLQPHVLLDLPAGGGLDPVLADIATAERPTASVPTGAGERVLTLNRHQGYARDDHDWTDAESVVRRLVEGAIAGRNLLIAVGPDALGEIPAPAARILGEVGRWADHHLAAVRGCGATPVPPQPWGCCTGDRQRLYAHVLVPPRNRRLVLPRLAGAADRARLLADGSELPCAEERGDLVVTLPERLPEPWPAVVGLRLVTSG